MVSGGQDSLTLLHLTATGWLGGDGPSEVSALHVNHHLRGDDSEHDQYLVERRCEALGVPLTVRSAPLRKGAGDLQEVARDLRRAAAQREAAATGAERIVLGHTLDDQVETVLYRLGRYGGLAALAAMRPFAAPWVRPLLTCRRTETAAYCEALGLEYARDRGNADPTYARTAIRERLVPAWEEALPGAVIAVGRAAEVAAETMDLVSRVLAETDVWAGAPEAEGASLSARRLSGLGPDVRRAFLHDLFASLPGAHRGRALVLQAETLLGRDGSASLALGGGWCLLKEYDRLRVTHERNVTAPSGGGLGDERIRSVGAVPLGLPGSARWGDLVVSADWVDRVRAHDPREEAFVDAAAFDWPLEVRAVRPGDRMQPLGAPGSRSLKDILVDLRVPRHLRDRIPLVTCADRVVWLTGFALAEQGRIQSRTRRVVHLAVRSYRG